MKMRFLLLGSGFCFYSLTAIKKEENYVNKYSNYYAIQASITYGPLSEKNIVAANDVKISHIDR